MISVVQTEEGYLAISVNHQSVDNQYLFRVRVFSKSSKINQNKGNWCSVMSAVNDKS